MYEVSRETKLSRRNVSLVANITVSVRCKLLNITYFKHRYLEQLNVLLFKT